MKISYRIFVLLGLSLLAIIYFVYWRAQVPSDFAIKMSGLSQDKIDTFSEKYSRAGVERRKVIKVNGKPWKAMVLTDATIPFNFTRDERRELYLLLQQMNYTNYPTDIAADCKFQSAPSHKVNLTIRANKMIKHISYETGCRDDTKQRLEFRRFIELLHDMAHRHEEVRQLPQSMMFDM